MQIETKENNKRLLGTAVLVAGGILTGSALAGAAGENVGLIWLTAAVYMLTLLAAALLAQPLQRDRWLFVTAVLLSLSIIIPAAILNPSYWAAEQLPLLGMYANILFFVLLISQNKAGRPSRTTSWFLTGFYVIIMVFLAFLI